ncbi:MAG: hypothetical protein COV30_00150 [Candidatus Yanofskybacteria bacterium CG10_big_fil_rev_8_21_14_0_10_37_15]|uniref:Uncharacterized protein n=1 Tax=Candidatus Yanofskybacteria bacterium CG10_big_fil_rev_8_21_14_0_10_37_15 TaxID=1975097 RepID=A0A2H0R6G5_9BACT|nr:MAG: hypothetical protein COV30_00150 [Candidatus Yanofskybacteria bacterium CG10_big_fil_rev_8_21_14_0_10_37_15]
MFLNFFSTILALIPPRQTSSSGLPPGKPITFDELDILIQRVAQFILVISVVLAVIFIVRAGITWMSAGSDTKKVDNAKAQLRSAIIGAFVVLGVGVIINTIASIVTREFFCQLRVLGVCIIP